MHTRILFMALSLSTLCALTVSAQTDSSAADHAVNRPNVAERSVPAITYQQHGSTKVNFRGTDLAPEAYGSAKVESKSGRMEIHAKFKNLPDPNGFGSGYLTYVVWAVTPEGRPINLGEVVPGRREFSTEVTVNLQNFGMMVTAEPYFAVIRPGNMEVLENVMRKDTRGSAQPVNARYEEGDYSIDLSKAPIPSAKLSTGELVETPREMLEARNAVSIAEASGAKQYAPEAFTRAQDLLHQAEATLQGGSWSAVNVKARAATQAAEDARVLGIRNRLRQEPLGAAQARAAKAEEEAAAARQQAREAEARTLVVSMHDVLFDTDKAMLKPGAKLRLEEIATTFKSHPDLKVQLKGYTDSTGSQQRNEELSHQRANAVRDYLVSQGVKASSITVEGSGASDPVASNNTAAGRQLNRRVDVVVTSEAMAAREEQEPAVKENVPGAMAEPQEGQREEAQPENSNQQQRTPDSDTDEDDEE